MGTPIHWLAILAAAVAAFLVGGVWYSALFGKLWMKARGVTAADVNKDRAPVMFGLTFLLEILMAFVLDHVFGTYAPKPDMGTALMIAGGVAIGFVIPAMNVNYLYQQARKNLFLIDGGHWLAAFLAMGAVLNLLT